MTTEPALLTCKELAVVFRKSVSYVYAARRRGFRMPGNVATRADFAAWLDRNGSPRSNRKGRRG